MNTFKFNVEVNKAIKCAHMNSYWAPSRVGACASFNMCSLESTLFVTRVCQANKPGLTKKGWYSKWDAIPQMQNRIGMDEEGRPAYCHGKWLVMSTCLELLPFRWHCQSWKAMMSNEQDHAVPTFCFTQQLDTQCEKV